MKTTLTMITLVLILTACKKENEEPTYQVTISANTTYGPFKITWSDADGDHTQTITGTSFTRTVTMPDHLMDNIIELEKANGSGPDSLRLHGSYDGKNVDNIFVATISGSRVRIQPSMAQ